MDKLNRIIDRNFLLHELDIDVRLYNILMREYEGKKTVKELINDVINDGSKILRLRGCGGKSCDLLYNAIIKFNPEAEGNKIKLIIAKTREFMESVERVIEAYRKIQIFLNDMEATHGIYKDSAKSDTTPKQKNSG